MLVWYISNSLVHKYCKRIQRFIEIEWKKNLAFTQYCHKKFLFKPSHKIICNKNYINLQLYFNSRYVWKKSRLFLALENKSMIIPQSEPPIFGRQRKKKKLRQKVRYVLNYSLIHIFCYLLSFGLLGNPSMVIGRFRVSQSYWRNLIKTRIRFLVIV